MSEPKKVSLDLRYDVPQDIGFQTDGKTKKIDFGIHKVRVSTESRRAVYDPKLIWYVKSLGKIEYYLSNVKLPCEEGEYYTLFAKYKYGWCVVAPLEG